MQRGAQTVSLLLIWPLTSLNLYFVETDRWTFGAAAAKNALTNSQLVRFNPS